MKTTLAIFRLIVMRAIASIYIEGITSNIELKTTKKEFRGHITLVLFPLVKIIKKPLKQIGKEIGEYVKKHLIIVHSFHLLNGFLNFECSEEYYFKLLKKISKEILFLKSSEEDSLMIEYSSPNTNKPLHLGHIRNHLLGNSISEIFKAFGHNVIKIQIINDRGIHICKSMLAWKKFSSGETPEITFKGDHLIGKYYVAFEKAYKKEVEDLCAKGYEKELAEKQAPIMQEVRKLLLLWEKRNVKTWYHWRNMNSWAYEGIEQTYCSLGIYFDDTQYESKTYLLGKSIIEDGLKKGVFYKKEDGSVWVDFTNVGLDEKLLLRSDGTSVYITQDLGTAVERFELYSIKSLIYIVGEEQEYHFKVLFLILKYMRYAWADRLFHLSYGLVQLLSGKMKSREGIIIDADNLIDEMHKLAQFLTYQKENTLGIGALKYFLLKIDTKKRILYHTKSSIDFNGNTGPYIQYTNARISSLYRKAFTKMYWRNSMIRYYRYSIIGRYEKYLLKYMEQYTEALLLAKKCLIPSIIANYAYNLSKTFNDFYQNVCIINIKNKYDFVFRLFLSKKCGNCLKKTMNLLGIEMPEYV
ncbi:arginyl-tRNA synthetase [Candidatus Uzinura diaspidicola str. ASNER]|uniref:Arginine--tRNA ligase n=1 Tax=Candidatus Uzinura diaspidicola str. ASNER TaxID=1133592 RepID=L7VG46_9FLAO|nr:arginyl-tRNA synthetase [Candidatus Uzinura diaspidicola str. ASNER]